MNRNDVGIYATDFALLGLQPVSKAAAVAQELFTYIASGIYRPGDKLPSERELAQRFAASRTVIREALAALRIAGVVERRPGDGTYVRVAGQRMQKVRDRIVKLFERGGGPIEAWRAREIVEPCIAQVAAAHATVEDLRRLSAAVNEMSAAINTKSIPDFYKADRDFHLTMVSASHNAYLVAMLAPLLDWVTNPLWWEIKRENIDKDLTPFHVSLVLHEEILRSIANYDTNGAYDAVKRHFAVLGQYLLASQDEGRE